MADELVATFNVELGQLFAKHLKHFPEIDRLSIIYPVIFMPFVAGKH